ncbi:hypothetical protein [Actinoplanes sp. NPDC051494]|uniref:hypothetical protein n=1 Tax=Actinoplanes sp. NPDC051494 TaxID=3363907 RepID=UPI00379A5E0B
MLIDTWLLQHAAELAEQAGTQLALTTHALQREAHTFMEEITHASGILNPLFTESVNGGCAEN